jgi:hypothetical protein
VVDVPDAAATVEADVGFDGLLVVFAVDVLLLNDVVEDKAALVLLIVPTDVVLAATQANRLDRVHAAHADRQDVFIPAVATVAASTDDDGRSRR